MYLDDCTEELLDAHEAELKELQQYYDSSVCFLASAMPNGG